MNLSHFIMKLYTRNLNKILFLRVSGINKLLNSDSGMHNVREREPCPRFSMSRAFGCPGQETGAFIYNVLKRSRRRSVRALYACTCVHGVYLQPTFPRQAALGSFLLT